MLFRSVFQGSALPPQGLGALRVFPDAGLSEFEFYLGEAFAPLIDVKDTP